MTLERFIINFNDFNSARQTRAIGYELAKTLVPDSSHFFVYNLKTIFMIQNISVFCLSLLYLHNVFLPTVNCFYCKYVLYLRLQMIYILF